MKPILLVCAIMFSAVMAAYKWAVTGLLDAYGWTAVIPVLAALFTYAVLVDRREARRQQSGLPPRQ